MTWSARVALPVLAAVAISACGAPSEKRGFEYTPDMVYSVPYDSFAPNPVTRDGKTTTPITYDSNCLEEVCGSCAMLVNGKARMACSDLLDNLEQPSRLEPFSKFPVVRDLATDRSVIFENLKAVKAWVPVDGSYDLGAISAMVEALRSGADLVMGDRFRGKLAPGSMPWVHRPSSTTLRWAPSC